MAKAVVLHNVVPADASAAEQDTLVQVRVVSEALRGLGFELTALEFSFDTGPVIRELASLVPDLVFNLVEAVDGVGRFQHLAPALLEHLGLRFTGASSRAVFLTTDKLLTKRVLVAAGIPTPTAFPSVDGKDFQLGGSERYIVKSTTEDASLGIDEHSVLLPGSVAEIEREIAARARRFGGDWFAERFVAGRELNLAFLPGAPSPGMGGAFGLDALPPGEIRFEGFPAGRPKIVDYRSKWDADAPEFNATHPSFDFPPSDMPLLAALEKLARKTLTSLDVGTYARVDVRLDEAGDPWVLEVNVNPCIAPDSPYVLAALHAGVELPALVGRIVGQALGR